MVNPVRSNGFFNPIDVINGENKFPKTSSHLKGEASNGARISAILAVYNEEKQIRECLESIKWVDEIIVVDSFSNDRTVEICKEYTDKIYQRKDNHPDRKKNWGMDKASCNWILIVDADERYTPELANEVRNALEAKENYDGYYIPYCLYCFGKEIKGNFWQEHRINLFRKGRGRLEDKEVHAHLILKGKAERLKNPIYHYPYPNLKVLFDKFDRYTTWEAKEMLKNEDKFKWYNFFISMVKPMVLFYRLYVVQRSFKDGLPGLILSIFSSLYYLIVDIKYWRFKKRYKLANTNK